MIVLVRMFGGLNKAKEEIGLMPTPTDKPLYPFEYYRDTITEALNNLYEKLAENFLHGKI